MSSIPFSHYKNRRFPTVCHDLVLYTFPRKTEVGPLHWKVMIVCFQDLLDRRLCDMAYFGIHAILATIEDAGSRFEGNGNTDSHRLLKIVVGGGWTTLTTTSEDD